MNQSNQIKSSQKQRKQELIRNGKGDIVKLDVSVFMNGYHGDCCATFPVGKISEEAQRLIDVARQARDDAIAICKVDVPFHRIGHKIGFVRSSKPKPNQI